MSTKKKRRRKKLNHRKEGDTDHRHHKHSPLKGRKGDTPLGYSRRTTLRKEQCNVDGQSIAR
jgi:ribosomal protein L3